MRHRVKGKKLNRDVQHRIALFKNLVSSLIKHGSIETTEAKAKAVKGMVDKLMTKAKAGGLHNRRQIDKVLNQTDLVNRLVDEIAPKTGKRTSGFTRLIRLGSSRGDAAMSARLEFVDQVKEVKEVKTVAVEKLVEVKAEEAAKPVEKKAVKKTAPAKKASPTKKKPAVKKESK